MVRYSALGKLGFIAIVLGLLSQARPTWAQQPTWQSSFSGNASQPTKGISGQLAPALDASGNVYMVGSFEGQIALGNTILNSAGATDLFLAKQDAAANNWAWAVSGGGDGRDFGTGVAVSGTSVYVTSSFAPSIYGSTNVVIAGTALACM